MSDAVRFVVSQIDWAKDQYGGDNYFRRTAPLLRLSGLDTFDDAEPYRSAKAAARCPGAHLFLHGGAALFYQPSLDAPRLHDWLMDAGIEPPTEPPDHSAWVEWWRASVHKWSAEQRAHAWSALDKVRFFTVSEERPSSK